MAMTDQYAGMAAACVKQAISEHEDAAVSWAKAREKLFAARNESQRAETVLGEATKAEVEAWNRLENVAGRNVPQATCSGPSYR